jgi:hypothetical protein
MTSFHNDPTIKEKYLARVRMHRAADNLIQGTGWEYGKGCAVGCTLENYSHSRYPIELGLPEWLAFLEDHIFEALSTDDAMAWPEAFLSAIPVGVSERNMDILRDQFQIFWLTRQKTQFDQDKYPQVVTAIDGTIALLDAAIAGEEPASAAWSAAGARHGARQRARQRGMERGTERSTERSMERGTERGMERGTERGMERGMRARHGARHGARQRARRMERARSAARSAAESAAGAHERGRSPSQARLAAQKSGRPSIFLTQL